MPRSLFRLAKGIVAFVLVAFALLVLWLRYVTLPNVDNYRDRIVRSLSQSTGMQVSARSLYGGWEGLRPYLSLGGLAINDRKGRLALGFERLSKPIVAAINGHAIGGGLTLACMCDIRVCSADARLELCVLSSLGDPMRVITSPTRPWTCNADTMPPWFATTIPILWSRTV